MAFNLFKKKKENVVDFTPRDSNMPIPAKMKDKLMAGNSQTSIVSASSPSSNTSGQSSGGFFSFFGGSSDSSSTTSSPSPAPASTPTTDFWGNPVSSCSSQTSPSHDVSDINHRISRMTDRLELSEKKIERLERKLGIIGEGQDQDV